MGFIQGKRVLIVLLVITLAILGWSGYSYFAGKDIANYSTGQEDSSSTYIEEPGYSGNYGESGGPVARSGSPGMPACICHSKNPAMVRMHDALEGESCSLCHKSDENLMEPNKSPAKAAEMEKRIKTEEVCKACHLKNGTIKSKKISDGSKEKMKIFGALFCPKCNKQLSSEDTTCGDCGGTVSKNGSDWVCDKCGPLVDVDKVVALSKEKPSNDICRLCHYDDQKIIADHRSIKDYNSGKAGISGDLKNCLACHESHNQCGGCHF